MPALRGLDEQEAAELSLEFVQEMAAKLQRHYARPHWWGYSHPYLFRGRRVQWGRPLEDLEKPMGPPSLMNIFEVELRLRGNRTWYDFASFTLWRADWDDTPEMRSAVCTLHRPDMTPEFFRHEAQKFIKNTFGCENVRFLSVGQVKSYLELM